MQLCECDFLMDRIRNGGFQCFPSSPGAVTYRAELHGTLEATVPDLVEDITQWLSSDASISVQQQTLTIDTSCSVVARSLSAKECKDTEIVRSGQVTGTTAGIAIGVIVAIAVAIAIAIVIIILILRYKNHSLKMSNAE